MVLFPAVSVPLAMMSRCRPPSERSGANESQAVVLANREVEGFPCLAKEVQYAIASFDKAASL